MAEGPRSDAGLIPTCGLMLSLHIRMLSVRSHELRVRGGMLSVRPELSQLFPVALT